MLYIGSVKFVDDDRFELLPGNGYGDWTLRFRLIRESDAGKYECQISTSPKLSQTFTLDVVGKFILRYIRCFILTLSNILYGTMYSFQKLFLCKISESSTFSKKNLPFSC